MRWRHGWLLGLLAMPALAGAEGWGGALGLTSDYAWRGLSLSDQRPSPQADLHYAGAGGWFAGAGAALVRRAADNYAAAELSPYLGGYWSLDQDWSTRLTLGHYAYAGDSAGSYRYDELEVRLGFRQRLAVSLAASPDTTAYAERNHPDGGQLDASRYGGRGAAYAAALDASQPLERGLDLVGGVGYRDLQSSADVSYVYWSAGLAYVRGPWTVNLSRIGTSGEARRLCCGTEAVNRWVGSLFWHF